MSESGDRIAVAIDADEPRQTVAAAVDDTVSVPIEPTGSLAGIGGILTLATPSVVVIGDDIGNRPFAATRSRTDVPIVGLVGLSENPDRCLLDGVDTVVEYGGGTGRNGGRLLSEATIEQVVAAVEQAHHSTDQESPESPTKEPHVGPDLGQRHTDPPASERSWNADSGSIVDSTTDESADDSTTSEGADDSTTNESADDGGIDPSEYSTADGGSTSGTSPLRTNGGVVGNDSDQGTPASPEPPAGPDHDGTTPADGIAELPTETVAETAQTGPFIATGAVQEGSLSGTVVIGASTGGPGVLTSVLSALPVETDLRVLLVQHLRDPIVPQFADRIDEVTGFDVAVATDGGTVSPGEVAIARGNSHLVVEQDLGDRLRVRCVEAPRRNDVRPAADETMESAAAAVDGPLVGVLLTGIGVDGAEGLQAIKRAGGHTIAQDEATSNIFGMPAAAIESGAVDDVLPGDRIANGIVKAIVDQQE